MNNLDLWQKFLSGKWQDNMPNKAGTYPVKSINNNIPDEGFTFMTIYQNPDNRLFKSVHSWGGLWWSESMPNELPGE